MTDKEPQKVGPAREIQFSNSQYDRPELDLVLRGITFDIKSAEEGRWS